MTGHRARVDAALAAADRAGDLGAWIARAEPAEVRAAARSLRGDEPISGWALAVKDNVDVAGFATTAGHPAFDRRPAASARLRPNARARR